MILRVSYWRVHCHHSLIDVQLKRHGIRLIGRNRFRNGALQSFVFVHRMINDAVRIDFRFRIGGRTGLEIDATFTHGKRFVNRVHHANVEQRMVDDLDGRWGGISRCARFPQQ